MAARRRVVDEGLQAERTSLAWERTAMAFALNAALIGRAGADVPAARVLAFVVLGVAAAGFVAARTRYVRRDASLRGEAPAPGAKLVMAVWASAVGVSVSVLAIVVALAFDVR